MSDLSLRGNRCPASEWEFCEGEMAGEGVFEGKGDGVWPQRECETSNCKRENDV